MSSKHQERGAKVEVSVQDITKAPEKFAGQKIVVTGKVHRIEGPNAFILDGPGFFNDKILVIMDKQQQAGTANQQAGAASLTLKEKQKLQLTGKVEEIGVSELEETYKPGLKPEMKAEFKGTVMPVLIVPPNSIRTQG